MRGVNLIGPAVLVFIAVFAAGAVSQELPYDYPEPVLVAHGFNFPEGPVLDAEGNIYFVGLGMSDIKKVTPDGTVSSYFETGGFNQSCMFDKDWNLYVAHRNEQADDTEGIYKLDRNMKFTPVATQCNGEKLRPNDLTWDSNGRLYFTSPFSKRDPQGGVFFIDSDGSCKKFAADMMFPNGIVHDWKNNILYVSEEGEGRQLIWKYTLNPDGTAAGRTEHFRVVDGFGMDGMKLDDQGNIWIAMFGCSQIWCISPAGEKLLAIPIQGKMPTNLVFGGPDKKTAWVTVLHGEDGRLYKLQMPWAGVPIIPGLDTY